MNVAGAALATALSNTVSLLYLLIHVIRNRESGIVKLSALPQKISGESFREILSIGTPAALQILLAALLAFSLSGCGRERIGAVAVRRFWR